MTLGGSRVLVTGAAGFIGACVARELLASGSDVFALVRPTTDRWRLAPLVEANARLHLVEADLTDAPALESAVARSAPDLVVHCAAPGGHPTSAAERRDLLGAAVIGTENLLSALAERRITRFVHTGSSLEYGRGPVHVEDEEPAPATPRGVAKLATTLLCRQRALADAFPAVTLRLFSVYGPWESPRRLVPSAVEAALSGAELPLTGPAVRRDFVFVGDVAGAVLAALSAEGLTGEIVNIGSGQETSNEEIVTLVGEAAGRTVATRPGTFGRKPPDAEHWRADVSKARRLLGLRPTPLRDGLARTVAWRRARASWRS